MNNSFLQPSAALAANFWWQGMVCEDASPAAAERSESQNSKKSTKKTTGSKAKSQKGSLHRLILSLCLLPAMLGWASVQRANAGTPPILHLRGDIQVDAQGVFFDQVITGSDPLHIHLAEAPAFGAALTLTRAQVGQLLEKNAPNLASTNWQGAESIKITRQSRVLQEEEVIAALGATLQRDFPQNWGQLELTFMKPWSALSVPTEAITASIINVPISGLSPNFIVRFDLRCGHEILGNWALPVQAKLWREVLITQTPLRRGDLLQTASLIKEKRDVLVLRDAFAPTSLGDNALELVENLQAGAPLLNRSVRLQPVIQRGRTIDAVLQDGALMITVKVQALEDGVPGQSIRVRNLKSGREFRGKVENDQAVQVAL